MIDEKAKPAVGYVCRVSDFLEVGFHCNGEHEEGVMALSQTQPRMYPW